MCLMECKWKADHFDPSNLILFRKLHPEGENFVICYDVDKPYRKNYNRISVNFQSIGGLSQFKGG